MLGLAQEEGGDRGDAEMFDLLTGENRGVLEFVDEGTMFGQGDTLHKVFGTQVVVVLEKVVDSGEGRI